MRRGSLQKILIRERRQKRKTRIETVIHSLAKESRGKMERGHEENRNEKS